MIRKNDINLWSDDSTKNPTAEEIAQDKILRASGERDERGVMERPRLQVYMPEQPAADPCPAFIVCPGGGYTFLADHESEPVAEWFTKRGFAALVLRYHIAPVGYPAPFADAARAMRLARANADALGIDSERLGMIGFSAGAHLTAMTGFKPDLIQDEEDDLAEDFSARPDRIVLAYAPIKSVHGRERSAHHFAGASSPAEIEAAMDVISGIDSSAPPTFIYHTQPDEKVPVANAMALASACAANGVPFALHVYPNCNHGTVMGQRFPEVASWAGLLEDWLSDWGMVKA